MLKIDNITKRFQNKTILNDISLAVDRGSIAALVGPSGVGKSTLLRILNNLEKPDLGSITLDGNPVDLAQINQNHLVGMVFQQFSLFEHLTVERNITLPLEITANTPSSKAQAIAHELLTRYGLQELAHTYPHQLSGGQKQRLAIARAIALKPRIICFDEPTSALDPVLTTFVANNIQQLASEGYIILVATHDTTLIEKLACTIYLMDKGTILESIDSGTFYRNRDHYPHINRFFAGIVTDIQDIAP